MAEKTSRVIHARMEDFVILGCFNLLKSRGISIEGLPMSSAVSSVVEAVIQNMMDAGKLPNIFGVAATHKLNQIIGARDVQELDFNDIDFSKYTTVEDSSELSNHRATNQIDRDEIMAAAARIAAEAEQEKKRSNPDILFQPAEELEEAPGEYTTILYPWEAKGIKSFEELQIEAPKDMFIEESCKTNDIHYKHAIQIVYSQLPIDQWGTEIASKLIGDLITKLNKRFPPIENN